MIREAKLIDLPELFHLGLLFANESMHVHTFKPDDEKVLDFLHTCIINPKSVFLVYETEGVVRGFIIGTVLSPYFSKEEVMQELAFFSTARGGLKLLDAFEDEAKKRGITKIVAGSKPAFCDLSKIYKRKGYRILEEHFIKTEV